MSEILLRITKAEAAQLIFLLNNNQADGVHYRPADQYWKRHHSLKKKLTAHHSINQQPIPNFTASVDAALTLCDRLREEGWIIEIHSSQVSWGVEVWKGGGKLETAQDPSLAHAICLAFLKAQQPTEQETR